MSVVKNKRGESSMNFLFNARNLQIYSIQKCVTFPKRYTFYVSQPLANSATRVYEYAKRGNSIFPTNEHEVQIRRDCFIKANAELCNLSAQLEVAQQLFGIDMETMRVWADMIDTEVRLIKAVIKSDKSRFENI